MQNFSLIVIIIKILLLPQGSSQSKFFATLFALIDGNMDFDKVTNESGFVRHYL